MTRKLTRKQLQAVHARKNEILRERTVTRKNEILDLMGKREPSEPFTVKQTKTISQSDLIRMQREAGVR